MTNVTIKKRIMFHIYAIYLMRKLWAPFITESIIFATLATTLFFFVSVPNVVINMFGSGDLYHYFITAFSTTDFLVQTILILAGITMLLFVKNIAFHSALRERLSSVLSFLYSPFLVK